MEKKEGVNPEINPVCQYCNKKFSNKGTLKTHQGTAKYCLKLRGIDVDKREAKIDEEVKRNREIQEAEKVEERRKEKERRDEEINKRIAEREAYAAKMKKDSEITNRLTDLIMKRIDGNINKRDYLLEYIDIKGERLDGTPLDINNKEEVDEYISGYIKEHPEVVNNYYIQGVKVDKQTYDAYQQEGDNYNVLPANFYQVFRNMSLQGMNPNGMQGMIQGLQGMQHGLKAMNHGRKALQNNPNYHNQDSDDGWDDEAFEAQFQWDDEAFEAQFR